MYRIFIILGGLHSLHSFITITQEIIYLFTYCSCLLKTLSLPYNYVMSIVNNDM